MLKHTPKHFTTKDNITISYEVFGDETAPVILMIMGLGMPSAAWPEPLIAGLVQKGFRVVTFDNRDSGKSSKIEGVVGSLEVISAIAKILLRRPVHAFYSLEDMAGDAEALLNELHVKRAHIFGISMGGMIGQEMALHYPQRVLSLTSMMSASGNPRTGLGKLKAIGGILAKPAREDDVQCIARYLKKLFRSIGSAQLGYSEEQILALAQSMVDDHYEATAGARQLLAILSSGDRSRDLPRIIAPTLVVHGRNDPLLPLRAGEEVARLIPNARMAVIDGMGHDVPNDKIPEIVSFVSQHCHRYKE